MRGIPGVLIVPFRGFGHFGCLLFYLLVMEVHFYMLLGTQWPAKAHPSPFNYLHINRFSCRRASRRWSNRGPSKATEKLPNWGQIFPSHMFTVAELKLKKIKVPFVSDCVRAYFKGFPLESYVAFRTTSCGVSFNILAQGNYLGNVRSHKTSRTVYRLMV